MLSRKEILDFLKKNQKFLKKEFHLKEIGLFGSFVRSEQNEKSDIDILVDFEDNADLFDLSGLGIFIEEKLKHKVDIIPKRALRQELRELILNEVISL
jgi:predicted nucleotidyltransferase